MNYSELADEETLPAGHEHGYDDATGEPYVCPVTGCWFNQ